MATESLSWVEDFSTIRDPQIEALILGVGQADKFLKGQNQHFIAGAKGLGKTLLLINKRLRLQHQHSSESTSRAKSANVFIIPSDEPFLDVMSGERKVTKDEDVFLSDLNNAKKIWSFALKLSIFSYRKSDALASDSFDIYERATLNRVTGGHSVNPTDVFRTLFSLFSISEIHALIDKVDPILLRDLKLIHDANYIFIDAIDQSLSQLRKNAWINTQAGLLEAAYDLMRSNQHIKVYASIRMEAYASYKSPVKANISALLTELFYHKRELKLIIDHLTRHYEKMRTLEEFFNISSVKKNGHSIPEAPFDYVIRHTLGSPRELVHICRNVSVAKVSGTYDENEYRRVVNLSSGENVPGVLEEIRPILMTLTDDESIDRFFALIDRNILSRRELEKIILQYNGLAENSEIKFSGIENPFLDLYNSGLLGTVDRNLDTHTQEFRVSSQPVYTLSESLPVSEYYMIHPSLQARITGQNSAYRLIPLIIVGSGYEWHPWDKYLVSLEQSFGKIPSADEVIRGLLVKLLISKQSGVLPPIEETRNTISKLPESTGIAIEYIIEKIISMLYNLDAE